MGSCYALRCVDFSDCGDDLKRCRENDDGDQEGVKDYTEHTEHKEITGVRCVE